MGFPSSVQSDQRSNVMSGIFKVMYILGIKQVKSSAYHPESQGALERFHGTYVLTPIKSNLVVRTRTQLSLGFLGALLFADF